MGSYFLKFSFIIKLKTIDTYKFDKENHNDNNYNNNNASIDSD